VIPPGSYGSSITIEEITGSRGWSAVLSGSSLPHQGAGWGAQLRNPTEFYMGNPAGTQQVIGPKEAPSHWEGVWKRTLLLRTPATITPSGSTIQTSTPSTLAAFLEQLFLGGARLRVTWSAQKTESPPGGQSNLQIVREGRPAQYFFTPLTIDDWRWEVTWSWVNRGSTQQTAVSTRDGDTAATTTQVSSAMTDVLNLTGLLVPPVAANSLIPLSATPATLGDLETLSEDMTTLGTNFNTSILSLQTSLSATNSVSLSTAGSPSQLNNSLLNVSTETVSTCNVFTDTMGQMPFEIMSQSTQASNVAAAAGIAGGQVIQAWILREAAQKARQKALAIASTNPGGGAKTSQQTASTGPGQLIAVYRTCDGDTPQRVALKFYGNADRALDLLQANHLPLGQPSFVTGTVLLIPVLRTSASSG
jgi:hypothetical protein